MVDFAAYLEKREWKQRWCVHGLWVPVVMTVYDCWWIVSVGRDLHVWVMFGAENAPADDHHYWKLVDEMTKKSYCH